MTPIADMIRRLGAQGLSIEAIADFVATYEQANPEKKRSKHAEAQARYWARKQAGLITSDQNDQPDHTDQNDQKSSELIRSDHADGGSSFFLTSLDSSLGKKQESKKELVEGRRASDWPPNYRELFWQKYPNKVGKPNALKKLTRVADSGKVTWREFWAGLEAYCAKTDDRPWCNPETWINQERWADQPAAVNGARHNGRESSDDMFARLIADAKKREIEAGIGRPDDPPFGRTIDGSEIDWSVSEHKSE